MTRTSTSVLSAFALATIVAVICLLLRANVPWIVAYPAGWPLAISDGINLVINAVLSVASPLFRATSELLNWPMRAIREALQTIPWPVLTLGIGAISYRAGGGRLAVFAIVACFYIQISGYWQESLNSLALVAVAFPLSVLGGVIIGIAMNKSRVLSALLSRFSTSCKPPRPLPIWFR